MSDESWKPPFSGYLVEDLSCPACEAEAVFAREDSSEDPRPAYCEACHAPLALEVFESFGDARLRGPHD